MGREITFPQSCEKREVSGNGWIQAESLQQDMVGGQTLQSATKHPQSSQTSASVAM